MKNTVRQVARQPGTGCNFQPRNASHTFIRELVDSRMTSQTLAAVGSHFNQRTRRNTRLLIRETPRLNPATEAGKVVSGFRAIRRPYLVTDTVAFDER